MIWFPQSIPRHTFVLWMAVQERLFTQDKIAKWRPNEIMECILCKQCMDLHEHLFFQCNYSKVVWENIEELLDKRFSYNWKTIIEEVFVLAANRSIWSILRRLVIGAVVYYVWQERNNRLYNKGERSTDSLVQSIIDIIKLRMLNFIVKESNAITEVEAKWNITLRRCSQSSA